WQVAPASRTIASHATTRARRILRPFSQLPSAGASRFRVIADRAETDLVRNAPDGYRSALGRHLTGRTRHAGADERRRGGAGGGPAGGVRVDREAGRAANGVDPRGGRIPDETGRYAQSGGTSPASQATQADPARSRRQAGLRVRRPEGLQVHLGGRSSGVPALP